MKKRSLFAAVAMLIVSAIVLTSATYAWFAAGTTAEVAAMKTTVSNTDGSLLVSATGEANTWKLSISADDYAGIEALNNPLKPVDFKIATAKTSEPAIYGCTFDGFNFTAGEASASDYLAYTWYVKADAAGTINLAPSFSAGSGAGFVYGYVLVNGKGYVFGNTSDSYNPFADNNVKAADTVANNAIVDAGELTAGSLADTVNVDNPAAISFECTAGTSYTVQCWVWAEGQDAGCAGSVSNSGAGLSFAPSLTVPTP